MSEQFENQKKIKKNEVERANKMKEQ